jgi:DNA-binding response OmpR family regulator
MRVPANGKRSVLARLVTSAASTDRLVKRLGDGSDDFVLKSTCGRLSMRVRLAIEAVDEPVHRHRRGRFAVDWSRATITNGTSRASLTRTELRLLAALLERAGEPVQRATLIARTWPRDPLATPERENALAVYICTLRKRLKRVGLGAALKTVRGVGYRFTM